MPTVIDKKIRFSIHSRFHCKFFTCSKLRNFVGMVVFGLDEHRIWKMKKSSVLVEYFFQNGRMAELMSFDSGLSTLPNPSVPFHFESRSVGAQSGIEARVSHH
jgi:hypothetical protein